MNTAARLHHLLAHWVEHNEAHAQTYQEWADKAAQEGLAATGERIAEAVKAVEVANDRLREALIALPDSAHLEAHGQHHSHSHDHPHDHEHDHEHGHSHGHGR